MTGKRIHIVLHATALLATLMLARQAIAADYTWNGGSTYFDIITAWTPSGPPGALDNALFTDPGTYEVWWDDTTGNRTNDGWTVQNGHVTLRKNTGATYTYTATGNAYINSNGWLTLGAAGQPLNLAIGGDLFIDTGSFEILEGMASNINGYVGYSAGSSGTALVNGAGSTWTHIGDFYLGYEGDGNLTIQNGGTVNSTPDDTSYAYLGVLAGTTGTATVDGVGSSWTDFGFGVGSAGNGSLTVQNGGLISSNGVVIGGETGGTGTVTVDGQGSSWTDTGYFSVGYYGSGTLNIQNSGMINGAVGIIAERAGSTGTATIDGAGSNWTTDSAIDVGYSGDGTLTIQNAGTANSNSGIVGVTSSGAGTATVTGAGSSWTNMANLTVGSSGAGILNIQNGGTVSNVDGYLGRYAGATGTALVNGTGSTWTNNGAMYIGGDNSGAGGNGTLTIGTGGLVEVGITLTVWGTGTLNLNGGTVNTGDLAGDGVFNFNAGTLGFSNDLLLDAGSLLGTNLSLNVFKNLSVGGTTTLAGYNTLSLEGGTFSTGSLINNGGFVFNSGTFNLTGDNLTVGSSGLFGDRLTIGQNQTINVTNNTSIDSGAVLEMAGGTLGGGNLNNAGALTGDGRINTPLFNQASGEVRVGSGASLRLSAAGNINIGRIEVIGGEIEFDQDLTNQTGSIVARNAILRFSGGLANQGSLGLSFGVSDVFGDITNDGFIVQSGGGLVTFYDDVTNNGTIQTSTGSQAVFFGAVSGNGAFPGSGTVFFEGDLMPGSSPGLVDVGGDMVLGLSAHTIMEIAGLGRGTGYDAFSIDGSLSLGGTLDVVLYDLGSGMFEPQLGDTFDLFSAETITGDFDLLTLAALGGGLDWQLDVLADAIGTSDVVRFSVVTSAVPLPPSVWLFWAGLLGLIGVARRRAA